MSATPLSGGGDANLGLLLAHSLWELTLSLCKVIYFSLIALARLVRLAGPHFLTLTRTVYEFHRTQMTWMDVCAEAVFLVLIVWFLVFRKRIAAALRKFEASIADKSKTAARTAPHLALFTLALVMAIVGHKFLKPLTSPVILPLFTVVIPIITSVYTSVASILPTMRAIDNSSSSAAELKQAALDGRQKVLLWIVMSAYHSIATVLSIIPFSHRLLGVLPVVRELVLVLSIWAQISPVFVEIIFEVASPFIHYCTEKIPSSSVFQKGAVDTESASNFLLSALVRVGVMSPSRQGVARAIMQESTSFIIVALFLPMPTPVATLGVTIVALLLPAVRSAACIQSWQRGEGRRNSGAAATAAVGGDVTMYIGVFSSGRKVRKSSSLACEIIAQQQRWIEYWICLGGLWALRPFGVSLWPSIMMVLAWYLQHDFLKGAEAWCRRLLPLADTVYLKVFKLTLSSSSSSTRRLASAESSSEESIADLKPQDPAPSTHSTPSASAKRGETKAAESFATPSPVILKTSSTDSLGDGQGGAGLRGRSRRTSAATRK